MSARCTRVRGLLALLSLLAGAARGDEIASVEFVAENRATTLRFGEARKRLDEKKWSQAIEELQAILTGSGGDLVPISASHSVSARRLCRVQLAGLPAEALRIYRQRYETPAEKKLQTALVERDESLLRKVVEESFCTRAAEKAIDRLGDLAFERGRFDEAEEWWRLLAPPPDPRREAATRGFTLVYPDPSLDPARLQAKQLLARLFHNSDSEWAVALEAYRRRYGKSEGTLAGRTGLYVDTLTALAEERKKHGEADGTDWPTFGGDSSRGRVVPASEDILDRLSSLCREGPTWTFDLQNGTRQEDAALAPAVDAERARSLAFYPLVVGHRVFVADARHVRVYDARNGQSQVWYDAAPFFGGVNPTLKLPAPPDLRYTLTAAGDRLYVRLGAQDIGLEAPQPPLRFGVELKPGRNNESLLTCLRLQANRDNDPYLWAERAVVRNNSFFEGAPLVSGGLVWIASLRYQDNNQKNNCITALDCYADGDTSKPPRWRCDVCKTSEKMGEAHARHHLLTLAGSQLVYCTHNGAVVAVDAISGRANWAMRYPRRTLDREERALRDLAPVLFAAGRLYVAPADSDSLLCLDPATGRTLWEVAPIRVVHLLGVGQGRLIFTTPGGVRGVEPDTGNPVWTVPENGGGSSLLNGLTPNGRGLLIGDLVLFPTTRMREEAPLEPIVYALRQRDGRPADAPAALHRLPSGNMAYGNGILVVADRRTLSVFAPPRLLLDKRQAEARRDPDSASALFDCACAESDAGRAEEALQTFRRLEENLRQSAGTTATKKLLEKSHKAKQHLLLTMAQRAAEDKRWDAAEEAFRQAVALPLPPRYRLHALLRAAQIRREAKQPERADAIWKSIRSDESLRDIQTIDRQGRPLVGARGRVGAPSAAKTRSADATPLAPPVSRTWHVFWKGDERLLAGASALLFAGSPDGRLTCRLPSTGAVRWSRSLSFAASWAQDCAETLLVAGDGGIACLSRDEGEWLWHFAAPVGSRYPSAPLDEVRVVLDPLPPEPLSAFRFKAGRLFFLQGQRRLFALNAATGAVLWDRWAADAELRLPSPHGFFSPHYYAGAATVLVQTSRRRLLLDAANGRTIHEAKDNRELWPHEPLELDERTLCLTPDHRRVELVETKTGQSLWTYHPPGSTTLSGESPSVLGRGEVLLYVQPANIGYNLHRLDRSDGKPVWPHPRLLAAKTLDPSAWTFDATTIYGIEDDVLTARSLADGAMLWRRPLPGFPSWQTQRLGDYLAVWPRALGPNVQFRFRWPLGAIQWQGGSLPSPETIYPLSCYDPKTGRVVQRMNFRIAAPIRRTTALTFCTPCGSAIRLDAPHPFVAIGGEAWGLTARGVR